MRVLVALFLILVIAEQAVPSRRALRESRSSKRESTKMRAGGLRIGLAWRPEPSQLSLWRRTC
jgi:hypothetical protein